jgi:rsbT antagonist protein RsbS
MQVSREVVVASIQVDLDEDVLARFQEDLLGRVHETGSRAVILDVSGLETLDSSEFAALRRIIAAVKILGSDSVLVGLQPGVVSALIEVGADVDGLQTAIDLDAAFELLEPEPEPQTEPESEPESEPTPSTLDAEEDFSFLQTKQPFEDER